MVTGELQIRALAFSLTSGGGRATRRQYSEGFAGVDGGGVGSCSQWGERSEGSLSGGKNDEQRRCEVLDRMREAAVEAAPPPKRRSPEEIGRRSEAVEEKASRWLKTRGLTGRRQGGRSRAPRKRNRRQLRSGLRDSVGITRERGS